MKLARKMFYGKKQEGVSLFNSLDADFTDGADFLIDIPDGVYFICVIRKISV